jgi:hypothetical protein
MINPDQLLDDDNAVNHQVLHPGSRKLFRYWESLRAERKCPDRDEFNLQNVRDLVANLFILEFSARNGAYRYRLAGTGINSLFKSEMTGKDVLDGWDAFERRVIGRVLNAAQIQLQPALVRMRLIAEHSQLVGAEMLALPIRTASTPKEQSRIQLIGGMFPFTDPSDLAYAKVIDRQLITSRTIWTEHMIEETDAVPPFQREAVKRPLLRVIRGGRAD